MKLFSVFVAVIFILILSLSVAPGVYGQNLTYGIKGGISIPNLTAGDDDNPLDEGYSSRLGADYGGYVQYHFDDVFSASIGVEYCAQGGKKEGMQAIAVPDEYKAYLPDAEYLYADFKSEAILDYLIVPVLFRAEWSPQEISLLTFYAAAGPFAGFLVKAEQHTSGSSYIYLDEQGTMPFTPSEVSFNAVNDISSDTHVFNTGVNGFIGISLNFGRNSIFVEGGGNFGFLPIQTSSKNGKSYTGAGVVTVGYAYTPGE